MRRTGWDGTARFERSMGRTVAELIFVPVFAIAFLGVAALAASGVLAWGLEGRIVGALVFGFFGLLLAAGAATTFRRGLNPTVLEVGPGGLWTLEMGRLSWSEIAEVRLEAMRGVAGGDEVATRPIRRLGIVPLDPARKPPPAWRLGWSLAGAYFDFVRRIAPGVRAGWTGDPAPFGVGSDEIGDSFEDAVAAVRRYREVADADERRAREGPIRATYLRPGASSALAGVLITVVGLAFSLMAFVVISPGGFGAWPIAIFFLLIFLFPSSRRLVGQLRRARAGDASGRAGDRRALSVGPEGIWLPDMGALEWDQVAEVRSERAGFSGNPPIELWRLVVVPAHGAAGGSREGTTGPAREYALVSDAVDAPFDDVLSLVRRYHQIVEPG